MLKSVMLSVLLSLVILLGVGGCKPTPPKARSSEPAVIMEVLDPSLYQFSDMWKGEIGRRFDHAVGVLVHGGDFVEGQWIAGASLQPWAHVTPVTEIVAKFQAKYPDRTIVLLACNTGHLKLGIPGVYYAKSSVWCVPDRNVADNVELQFHKLGLFGKSTPSIIYVPRPLSRWQQEPDLAGNIFEFVAD